ncbi:MAG TPA: hypothetical protein PLI18_09870 [Pirellulaceae bacterium]|nr:hypothetical protein [Pirellulaceae bacterium]
MLPTSLSLVGLFLMVSFAATFGFLLGACMAGGSRRELELRLAELRVLLQPRIESSSGDREIDWEAVGIVLDLEPARLCPFDRRVEPSPAKPSDATQGAMSHPFDDRLI